MKKTLSILAVVFLIAWTGTKPLSVQGDVQAWQALLDCVENSNESHVKVEAVKKWIVPQLQKQLSDTTIKK